MFMPNDIYIASNIPFNNLLPNIPHVPITIPITDIPITNIPINVPTINIEKTNIKSTNTIIPKFRINKELLDLLLIKDCVYTKDKLTKILLKRVRHDKYEFILKDSIVEHLKLPTKYINIELFINYIASNCSQTIDNHNYIHYTYFQEPNYNI